MVLYSTLQILLFVITLVCIVTIVFERLHIKSLRNKLEQSIVEATQINNFLQIFSQNIEKMDNTANWMNLVARYLAEVVGADSVCIFDMHETYLQASGIKGAFPLIASKNAMVKGQYILEQLRQRKIMLDENFIGTLAHDQTAINFTDLNDERLKQVNSIHPLTALMGVSLVSDGKCLGVVCVEGNSIFHDQPFTSDQFNRLKTIAGQVVTAQRVMDTYRTMNEQKRLESELNFARALQQSLLPQQISRWGEFEIHAFTRASRETSGDFYDFVEIDKNRLLVVEGDASGKGIRACMVAAMARSFIRAYVVDFTTLKQLFIDLNDYLARDLDDGSFITLCACLLDKSEGTFEYVRGGHTDLLVYVHGHIRTIMPSGGALGSMPSEFAEDFDTLCIQFQEDMGLLLYTDGISEARAPYPFKEMFGEEKIAESFLDSSKNGYSTEKTVQQLIDKVNSFTENPEVLDDDQTVIVIRHAPRSSK